MYCGYINVLSCPCIGGQLERSMLLNFTPLISRGALGTDTRGCTLVMCCQVLCDHMPFVKFFHLLILLLVHLPHLISLDAFLSLNYLCVLWLVPNCHGILPCVVVVSHKGLLSPCVSYFLFYFFCLKPLTVSPM